MRVGRNFTDLFSVALLHFRVADDDMIWRTVHVVDNALRATSHVQTGMVSPGRTAACWLRRLRFVLLNAPNVGSPVVIILLGTQNHITSRRVMYIGCNVTL